MRFLTTFLMLKTSAQFKSKDATVEENLTDFGTCRIPDLDDEITLDELKLACPKEERSTADGWVPKMITEVCGVLLPVLVIIFNVILQHSIVPCKYSVFIALFKNKGSCLHPKIFVQFLSLLCFDSCWILFFLEGLKSGLQY